MKHRALLIEADGDSAAQLARWISRASYRLDRATSLAQARERLDREFYHLAVLEAELPDGQGLELLETLKERGSEVIMLSADGSIDRAVEAIRAGATEYLEKPVEAKRLQQVLHSIANKIELRDELRELRANLQELGAFGPLVGASPAMRTVYQLIERVAPTRASVMITGETGTGKELVAGTIHRLSQRKSHPFVPINCGSLPSELIESEFFGHERGAFTGAVRARRGVFERAQRGTLFLDEISEIPLELQSTLLRVLETGEYMRVGGESVKRTDARLISATNRDPAEAVEAGNLREDLLYRLNLFPLHLPPLREREGDIEILARHFLGVLNKREGTRRRWSDEAIEALEGYDWPGNVRELQNVVERSFIMAGDTIRELAVPLPSPSSSARPPAKAPSIRQFVGYSIKELERELILATLTAHDGNKRRTAEVLGISLKTLYTRLNRYGV